MSASVVLDQFVFAAILSHVKVYEDDMLTSYKIIYWRTYHSLYLLYSFTRKLLKCHRETAPRVSYYYRPSASYFAFSW